MMNVQLNSPSDIQSIHKFQTPLLNYKQHLITQISSIGSNLLQDFTYSLTNHFSSPHLLRKNHHFHNLIIQHPYLSIKYSYFYIIFIMSNIRSNPITDRTPKRPSPDRSPSPDTSRKIVISSTDSPKINKNQSTIKKDKSQNDKQLVKENKSLRQEIKKLMIQRPERSSITKQSFYRNIEEGKEKKIRFQDFTQDSKEIVFEQFNRLMKQSKELTNKRVRELEDRLQAVQKSHKKMCDLMVQNKCSNIQSTSRKSRISIPPIDLKDRQQQQISFATTPKQKHRYKNILKELQSQLVETKQQNKDLSMQLKEVYHDLSENNKMKDYYEAQINNLNEIIEDLRFKLSDKDDYQDPKRSFPSFVKVPIMDFQKKIQRLTEELQNERDSKNKSERAMQLTQNNYQISQQSLGFMKKQNQKLKQQIVKLQKELKEIRNYNKISIDQNQKSRLTEKNTSRRQQYERDDSPRKLKTSRNKQYNYLQIPNRSPSPSHQIYSSQKQSIFELQSKINDLEYENRQLSIMQKRYQSQNVALMEQIKQLQGAVNKYLYSSGKGNMSGRKQGRKDPEFEMIQKNLETMLQRIATIHRQIKMSETSRRKV